MTSNRLQVIQILPEFNIILIITNLSSIIFIIYIIAIKLTQCIRKHCIILAIAHYMISIVRCWQ